MAVPRITRPRDGTRNERTCRHDGKENGEVARAGVLCGNGDEQDVANSGDGRPEEIEDSTTPVFVGDPCCAKGRDEGEDVWWRGEEQRGSGSELAQSGNDGRGEECSAERQRHPRDGNSRVERLSRADICQHQEIHLRIGAEISYATSMTHKARLTTRLLSFPSPASPWSLRNRVRTHSRSRGVRNLAWSGQSCTIQMDAIAMTIVSKPSIMNWDVSPRVRKTHDPSPTRVSTNTRHLGNGITEDSTERSSQHSAGEEDGDSAVELFTAVPSSEEEVESGELYQQTRGGNLLIPLQRCLNRIGAPGVGRKC
jgi:hypothetical protein